MLREPYGAYDIKIRLENGTDAFHVYYWKMIAHTTKCKLSDALSNSNVVRRCARPIAGKMSARTSL